MNTPLKSLLIGAVVATITFVMYERMSKKRSWELYTAHYVLTRASMPGTVPANHDETVLELHKMSQILQTRCKNAGYPIHIKDLANGEKLDVTIQEVFDTVRAQKMITRVGRLEIHEVYTLQDMASLMMPGWNTIAHDSVEIAPVETTGVDTAKAIKFSELQAQPAKPAELSHTLGSIFTASHEPDGALIGWIAEKDTAVFEEMFRRELLAAFPADAKFHFGPAAGMQGRGLGVYTIRTYRKGSITIDNSDIKTAMQDFEPSSNPTVAFSFTSIGSRKWGMLTGKNIGRPLAILVDDVVVSAPRVESAITGGKAIISGSFFVSEALALADQLNSGAMPASFHIIKQEISPESRGINFKALLVVLVAFAIGTSASYLIFKLLKSN
jgi:SecD/SecF fusion protein